MHLRRVSQAAEIWARRRAQGAEPNKCVSSRLGSATFRDFLSTRLTFPPLGFKPRLLWVRANVSTYKFTFNKGGVSQGDKTVFKTENFSSLLGLAAEIKRRQKTSVPTPPSFTHGVSSRRCFLRLMGGRGRGPEKKPNSQAFKFFATEQRRREGREPGGELRGGPGQAPWGSRGSGGRDSRDPGSPSPPLKRIQVINAPPTCRARRLMPP